MHAANVINETVVVLAGIFVVLIALLMQELKGDQKNCKPSEIQPSAEKERVMKMKKKKKKQNQIMSYQPPGELLNLNSLLAIVCAIEMLLIPCISTKLIGFRVTPQRVDVLNRDLLIS